MSLQSALITIGIILIFAIYIVSAMLERKKSKTRQAKSAQSGLSDKDEPSLMGLEDSENNADEIPILDSPLIVDDSGSNDDEPPSDSELLKQHADPFASRSKTEEPDNHRFMRPEPEVEQGDNKILADRGEVSIDSGIDMEVHGDEDNDAPDKLNQESVSLDSGADRDETSTPDLLEDLVIPGNSASADEKNSTGIPDEPEDFDSAVESLLEDIAESDIDLKQVLEKPVFSASGLDEIEEIDDIEDHAETVESRGLESQSLADTGFEPVELQKTDDADTDLAGVKEMDLQDSADMEKDGDSGVDDGEAAAEIEKTEEIPVLEVSSQVQDIDVSNDNGHSTDTATEIEGAEIEGLRTTIENQRQTGSVAGNFDADIEVDDSDQSTERKAKEREKIEPTLSPVDEEESDQSPRFVQSTVSSIEFSYPKIQGFEKISQIDYWVKIHGDRDVGRETVLAQYNEAKASLTKISRIHGIKIPEKNWCDLEDESEDARFGDLIITIQLADQNGSVDAAEMGNFTKMVENLAEGTGRHFTYMAPVESALQQAQAIAEFVRFYDSIFVINIKPEQTDYFEGGLINRCATQLGLERSEANYFVRNKIMGKRRICLYSLANMSESGKFDFENIKSLKTRGVTFFTKPAANRSPGAVFSEMVDTAKAFAGRVKGEAIAPNHEDLSQEDVDQIRQSIEKVADDMEEQGMTPGSDEAMRIF